MPASHISGKPTISSLLLATLTVALFVCHPTFGLVTEVTGAATGATAQAWWQPGLVELARHPSRVYARQSEAVEYIYFNADRAQIVSLLARFSRAALRDHRVEIQTGPAQTRSLDEKSILYTAVLEIPDGVWNSLLNPDLEWREPRLTIHVASDEPMKPVEIPDNVLVQSKLAPYAAIAAEAPIRKRFQGRAPEENGLRAERVPPWKRPWVLVYDTHIETYTTIGPVRDDGSFNVWFSEDEVVRLKSGKAQLVASWTMAPGNGETLTPLPVESLKLVEKQKEK